ncbi:hypothetical protein JXR93_01605 [bacterium]|nr:hypothetical protein [bacterium]
MSAIVKTNTPFIDKNFLKTALSKLNVNYSETGNDIITERKDYYGFQSFIFQQNRFQFKHDSSAENYAIGTYPKSWQSNWKDWNNVSEFLNAVEKKYKEAEFEFNERIRKAEEEKYLQELERLKKEKEEIERRKKEVIEQNKNKIKENAKKHGYSVQEKVENNEIKLVLIRRTY